MTPSGPVAGAMTTHGLESETKSFPSLSVHEVEAASAASPGVIPKKTSSTPTVVTFEEFVNAVVSSTIDGLGVGSGAGVKVGSGVGVGSAVAVGMSTVARAGSWVGSGGDAVESSSLQPNDVNKTAITQAHLIVRRLGTGIEAITTNVDVILGSIAVPAGAHIPAGCPGEANVSVRGWQRSIASLVSRRG